jgi:hypothetical protein
MSGPVAASDDVIRALDRTLATRAARVELAVEHDLRRLPRLRYRRRRAGGPLTPARRAVVRAGRRLVDPLLDALADIRATGAIDFATRRYMLDYGGFAEMDAGDGRRTGRSGERPVAAALELTLSHHAPFWLLDLARGVTDMDDVGAEEVSGRVCRRLAGHADLTRAAAATSPALVLPPVARYGDLERLPLVVWLDADGHVRRLRYDGEIDSVTLDLVELGIEPPGDWSRLPDFGGARG